MCLVAFMISVVWGMDWDARAQSPSESVPKSESGGLATSGKSDEASLLKTQKDQVNYAIGVNLIGNFKKQGVDIDLNLVMKGMEDAFAGNKLHL